MAALSAHIPTQHISGITATDGAKVFAGASITNNINIGEHCIASNIDYLSYTKLTLSLYRHLHCILPRDPLQLLPCAANASFNASGKEGDPFCLPGTRVEVLERIRAWIDEDDKQHIFWLSGWAGTGKSTIARTVAREYYDQKRWVASFFFSRGGGDLSYTKFVGTVATQLAHKSQDFKDLLQKAITEDRGIVQRVLRDQWRELIVRPLSQLEAGSLLSPIILVIDALDECEEESNIGHVLELLAHNPEFNQVRLRVLVTSRPEIPIRDGFSGLLRNEHQDLVLHDISEFVVDRDISLFLKHSFAMISLEDRIIEQLVRMAAGLFIWAATACRFVHEGKKRWVIKNRLANILQSSVSVTEPEKHLNDIYIAVLRHSIPAKYSDKEKEELLSMLRHILGSTVVLLSPLSIRSLSRLLDVPKENVEDTVEDLHAILDIPKNHTCTLRLHHPSFRDFLLNKNRCTDSNFHVDEKQAHQILATGCVQLMSNSIKQDICSVGTPGVLMTNIESSLVERCLPPEIQYACLYWIRHLQKSGAQLFDNDEVYLFLQEHFLHWLEALALIGKISDVAGMLSVLGSMLTVIHSTILNFC